MKRVAILVPTGEAILSSIVGPFKILNKINQFLIENGGRPYYDIQLVSTNGSNALYGGLFQVNASLNLREAGQFDLIIVPAIFGDISKEIRNNSDYIPWIAAQHAKGAEIASLCMGAFLLAETGLLNGKRCTTHWLGAEAFRQQYPAIELLEQKVIVDENGLYSSGGAYSFLNLILHLVEKYNGREMALQCAKVFEVNIDREQQAEFAIFHGQKTHEDEPIKKAQIYIENNVGDKISVEKLADMFAISRRNFVRRFKKATSNTPLEYIQRVKVEAAKKKLESSVDSVNHIMYDIGYNDGKAFRNLFRKYTGITPTEYKSRYNRVRALN